MRDSRAMDAHGLVLQELIHWRSNLPRSALRPKPAMAAELPLYYLLLLLLAAPLFFLAATKRRAPRGGARLRLPPGPWALLVIGHLYLLTGMTIAEAACALRACGADPVAFDALVCSSGAELCYPWKELAADEEYAGHVSFRWPGEHVRPAVPRLGKADGAQEADLAADEAACSAHCHAYAVAGASKVKKVDSIRQSLRMRGFRCNLVYTRACTRLNVVPLSASRPLALRYLSIMWGIDLSKVAVLVGDKGDTDRERLLPGLHKTLVLPGLVSHGSEELLRDEDGFLTEDVVAMDAPNIVTLAEDQAAADILKAI